MRVDISPILKEPGLKFDYETRDPLVDPDLRLAEPVSLKLTLTNVGRGIHAQGTVSAKVVLNCGNCLNDFVFPVDISFSEEYLPEQSYPLQTAGGPAPEELSIFTYGEDHLLEFDEAVRQEILLTLPMRPVCKPDCKGLCPSCGKRKNEGECGCSLEKMDDRWSPLKALKISDRRTK